jgi:TPR repeat protein
MKSSTVLALILFAASQSSNAGSETSAIVAKTSYALSPSEISSLSHDAYAGAPQAAEKLSDRYFNDWSRGKRKEMIEKALDWAIIGAENGSPKAQFRAYQLLGTKRDKNSQIRALFWLQRSAIAGNEDAKNALEDCPTIDSKYADESQCFGPGSDGNM